MIAKLKELWTTYKSKIITVLAVIGLLIIASGMFFLTGYVRGCRHAEELKLNELR